MGGTSVVWRANDDVLDRIVAVKILAEVDDSRLRHTLRAEARACGKLNHPRIAQVYDYGEVDIDGESVTPYIVMELVDGQPLSRQLAAGTTVPVDVAAVICAQIAEALAYAHANGLVHRDIKPENVIITSDGVKLVDFGISAAIGATDADTHGQLLGTPAYVAPERIINAPVGPAADMYSLGVLLYRMLTGTLPWATTTRTQLLEAHLYLDPAPLSLVDGLPDDIALLCAACLSKDPRQRPTSLVAAEALRDTSSRSAPLPVFSGEADTDRGPAGIEAPPAGSSSTAVLGRRSHRKVVLAVAALVMGSAAAAWGITGRAGHVNAANPYACVATLTVIHNSGSVLAATFSMTNTGLGMLNGWETGFVLPGRQTIIPNTVGATKAVVTPGTDLQYSVAMTQVGSRVIVRADTGILSSGATATIPVRVRHQGVDLLPTAFVLNGHSCQTRLSAQRNPTQTGPSPSGSGPRPPSVLGVPGSLEPDASGSPAEGIPPTSTTAEPSRAPSTTPGSTPTATPPAAARS